MFFSSKFLLYATPINMHNICQTVQELNENAATLFKNGEESDVEEGVVILNDCVIPCMHLMVRDSVTQEDMDAIEAIRSHWCSYLEQEMNGET